MSVARSAYRQLLRVGKKVSDKYTDPNDMCFALFGLLVTRQDFINAGYGANFRTVLRTCFLRPSIRDDPHDTVSARISAAFDALRRLNEICASNAAFRIRELRQKMADISEEKDGATTAAAGTTTATTDSSPSPANPAGDGASPSASAEFAATSSPSATVSTMSTAEALAAATSSPARAASRSKTSSTIYKLDEGVDLIRGSVLIERSSRRRIQNFPRHCVVCEPISMVFPPYRFCVPPEPAYLLAVRNEFALYGITDVLLALSATSIFNAHRWAYLHIAEPEAANITLETGVQKEHAGRIREVSKVQNANVASSPAAEPIPRNFPTTREELWQLVHRIPTHTIVQTDVLEVEITTEYVCSNPASTSNGFSSTASASTSAAQRKKNSMDGAFTSTTPLKGGTGSPSSSSSRNSSIDTSSEVGIRQMNASSANSATSGPGSPPSEDDDTKAHLFLYYVYVRNRGPQKNPHRWHAQILSHHLVVVDVGQAQALEMGRPGVMGNFPLLPPGASHCFESGTTLSGPEGFLRGSIQVNLFNDAGEMIMLDAAIAPTRLTVEVTSAKGFTSAKSGKEELVQRTREDASDEDDKK